MSKHTTMEKLLGKHTWVPKEQNSFTEVCHVCGEERNGLAVGVSYAGLSTTNTAGDTTLTLGNMNKMVHSLKKRKPVSTRQTLSWDGTNITHEDLFDLSV